MSRAANKADAAHAAVLAELRPGQSIELLKELHILTREGRLNQDSRRKLKQVYHLYQFIEPLLAEMAQDGHAPLLADHGAGKSYLGFILYDLFFKQLGRGEIYGIEWRAELVQRSRELAARLGFDRMRFLDMSVAVSQACSAVTRSKRSGSSSAPAASAADMSRKRMREKPSRAASSRERCTRSARHSMP